MTKLCRGEKVVFSTPLDAKIVLADRIKKDKGEVDYYRCEVGNHYHLTSQAARGGRKH